MAESKIGKRINAEIDELKLLGAHSIFILDHVSTIEEEGARERVIIGRIFPSSDIFKQGAFIIEMKLPFDYPFSPPTVRFLTPIYHPNVDQNGEFRHELLTKAVRWFNSISLVEIIRVIVRRIDEPDVDDSINHDVAKEYQENRDQFNRKALEEIKRNALPRN